MVGYRHWHGDVRPDDSPLECSLGFTCRRNQGNNDNNDYLGSRAVQEKRESGSKKRLACFTIEALVDDDNNIVY